MNIDSQSEANKLVLKKTLGPDKNELAPSLLRMLDWWICAMEENAKALGLPKLGRSKAILIAHISLGEHRPVRLAEKLGLTRQAVHLLINQLVEMNVLQLTKDPDDGRASIVQFVSNVEGRANLYPLLMKAIEKHLERRLGKKDFQAFLRISRKEWGDHPLFSDEDLLKISG